MREIIFEALSNDSVLFADYGIDLDHVFPNYAVETTPRDNCFIIIRYEEQDLVRPAIGRGPHIVTIWVHNPKELGTDVVILQEVLEEVKAIMVGLSGESDGKYEITDVRFTGMGGDLSDPGYNTFTKNAGFEVLYHRVG